LASILSIPDAYKTAGEIAVFAPVAVLRNRDLQIDLGDKDTRWRQAARQILAGTLEGVPSETLRWTFEREPSGREWIMLGPLAQTAKSAEAGPDSDVVELFVLGALRAWALPRVRPGPRAAIVPFIMWLQLQSLKRIQGPQADFESAMSLLDFGGEDLT
jgi:hypothetical protein